MAEIDAANVLPTDRLQSMVAEERVTQLHRGHAYAEEGDTFEVDGKRFEVVAVEGRHLGDLTEADARAEGSEDLEAYRHRLEHAHDDFEWDDETEVVRHRFEAVE
jgi:hypothetical protein